MSIGAAGPDGASLPDQRENSQNNRLSTTRPDGRPHAVPVDGVWLDDTWYWGGHPDTIHQRREAP